MMKNIGEDWKGIGDTRKEDKQKKEKSWKWLKRKKKKIQGWENE